MPKNKPGRAPRAPPTTSTSTIYFYLPNSPPYGVFSQWYPSPITIPTSSLAFLATTPASLAILDSHSSPLLPPFHLYPKPSPLTITFPSAEQLHTFSKALLFAAAPSASLILSTTDPRRQKALGRAVPHFNEYKWTRVKSRVVEVGNWYKFTQDEGLKRVLLGTGDRELVEASGEDRVWGIGFKEEEAEGRREEWGENRLGRALGRVRGRIRGVEERKERGEEVQWEWDGDWEGEEGDMGVVGEGGEKREGEEGGGVET